MQECFELSSDWLRRLGRLQKDEVSILRKDLSNLTMVGYHDFKASKFPQKKRGFSFHSFVENNCQLGLYAISLLRENRKMQRVLSRIGTVIETKKVEV